MKPIAYKHQMLVVLLSIFAFNYVDRLALGLLLQDIKVEFALSDSQLGLLTGLAFALFYSVMGIPIARWADRGNRVTIISLTTAVWSAAVAMCALAGSFMQLLLIRVGVAVGEAGCMPPAHSLIADSFTRAERPRAVAIYMLGGPLSFVLGYFLAGWLNQFYGWRVTFIVLGLPGIALAVLARLILREPRITQPITATVAPAAAVLPPVSLMDVCTTLWASRTFRHLLLAFAIMSFFGWGVTQWKPAFFMRSFGLGTGELGTWFAVIYGLGGLLGTYLGGAWASRYAANDERLQLKVTAVSYSSFALISAAMYLSPNKYMAFGLLALATVGSNLISGPLFATIQTVVPARMRAMSIALIYLFANLIGMGLGPLASGVLSDVLRPHFGEESLRYALLMLCPGYLWAGWHLWRSSKSVTDDIRLATQEN